MNRKHKTTMTVAASDRRSPASGRCKQAGSIAAFCCLLTAGLLFVAGCEKNDDATKTEVSEAEQAEKENAFVSVDLGTYCVREPKPIENLKIDLRFAVQAAVRKKDQERFEQYVASHENKVRDQIILAVRTAESFEFDEPKLDMLRHRILLRIASVLGGQSVEDLYVTDFHCQID